MFIAFKLDQKRQITVNIKAKTMYTFFDTVVDFTVNNINLWKKFSTHLLRQLM